MNSNKGASNTPPETTSQGAEKHDAEEVIHAEQGISNGPFTGDPERTEPENHSSDDKNVDPAPAHQPETLAPSDASSNNPEEATHQPETVPPSTPTPSAIPGNSRKRRRFSVQGELEQMKAEEERLAKAQAVEGPKSEFSAEELAKAWEKALEYLLANNQINLHSTLNEEGYELNGTVLATIVHSQTQKKELDEIATAFTEIIRGEVNNFALTLNIQVSEIDEKKYDSFAVDSAEKFSLMAAKNPALLKLKDALDLRF